MSDELRDQIAKRIEQECWAAAKVGGGIDFGKFVQAAMEIVGPLVVERDRMHMLLDKMRLEHADYARDAGHLQEQTQRERDLLLWLHAEAVWQRDQLRVEADQWTVRRQMGHRVIDADSELTEAVDLARWLLAEMAWQQDVYRQAWARAEVEASIVAVEHQKWAAAIAETAVRLSDAGYYGQLVDSVTRLIAERDADRDSRFRWAEEAAHVTDAAKALLDMEYATASDNRMAWSAWPIEYNDLAVAIGWRGAKRPGDYTLDDLTMAPADRTQMKGRAGHGTRRDRGYEQPAGVAKRTVRRGRWEITQAAGVSGTGTEASDGE